MISPFNATDYYLNQATDPNAAIPPGFDSLQAANTAGNPFSADYQAPQIQSVDQQQIAQGGIPGIINPVLEDAQVQANMIQAGRLASAAAAKPQSPWERGQDTVNQLFGSIVAPAMQAFGGPAMSQAGADLTAQFRDQVTQSKKERRDQINNSLSQLKNISGVFDGLNRTQVAEFGRQVAMTNAERQRIASEAKLAEMAAQHAATTAQKDRLLEQQQQKLDWLQSPDNPANKLKESQTNKTDAQTGEIPKEGESKREHRKNTDENRKGMLADKQTRTKIYQQSTNQRGEHMVNQDKIGSDRVKIGQQNADTAKERADTQQKAAQYKMDHPKVDAKTQRMQAIADAISGKTQAVPQVAQAAAAATGAAHPLAAKYGADKIAKMQHYLHLANGDIQAAKAMAAHDGFSL